MPFSPKRTSFPPPSTSFSSFLLPNQAQPSSSSSTSLLPLDPPSPIEEPFSPHGVDDHDGNWEKVQSSLIPAGGSNDEDKEEQTDLDGGGEVDLERAAFRQRRRRGDDEDGRWGGSGGRRRSSIGERLRGRLRGWRVGLPKGGRRRSSFVFFVGLILASWLLWSSSYSSGGLQGWRSGKETVRVDTRMMPWSHPERDTIIFYTILGSDLPPRHSPNQTLVNLSFMLANENLILPSPTSNFLPHTYLPPTLKIERKFLLNRLVPGPDRDALVELLERKGKIWEEVEWKDESWREVGFRWDGLGEGGGRWGFGGNKTTGEGDEGVDLGREGWKELDWALSDQNKFAMHNNGARNHALSLAFSLPSTRYAIPLDSNCAFTHAGIAAFLDTIATSEAIEQRNHLHHEPGEEGKKWEEETKDFVIVPMSRLVRNEDFGKWNGELAFEEGMGEEERRERWEGLRPSAPAEPQIAFRFTSTTRFDPSFRYGRRPKLSLLWALGWVPFSRSLHLKTHPWELPDRTITAESFSSLKHMTVEGGWTMRLFSGNEELEREDEVGMADRAGRRVEGVVRFLEGLEVRGGKPATLGVREGRWGFEKGEQTGGEGKGEQKLETLEGWIAKTLEAKPASYGFPILEFNDDTIRGYAFPRWLHLPSPSIANLPKEYLFPFDPLTHSPLPLLHFLSSLPPTSTSTSRLVNSQVTPFLPLLQSHLHYLLHSPLALALSSSSLAVPTLQLAQFDLHVSALAFFLEDWPLVARVATRVGLRIEILLTDARRESGVAVLAKELAGGGTAGGEGGGGGAWAVWDSLGEGLRKGGWRGWTFREGHWKVGGKEEVSWEGLVEAVKMEGDAS